MGREERPVAPTSFGRVRGDLTDDQYIAAVEAGLVDGEKALASLDLRHGMQGINRVGPDSLVLTQSRLIHVAVASHERSTSIVSLRDVRQITVESERHGPSAYVWGVLAIILAFALWRVIEHEVGSVAGGIAVAAMGVYLIADKIFSPITSVVVVLSEESPPLRCELRGARANTDIHDFISRVYALKEEISQPGSAAKWQPRETERRSRYANRVSE